MIILSVAPIGELYVYAAGNDSFSTAKVISTNTSYTDNLSTSSEQDYFKFTLSSSSMIAVNFNHTYIDSGSTYWVVRMYDSSYQELLEFNVKGNSINSLSASTGLASGTYYVKIGNYNYDNRNYTFSLNATTSNYWEKELNDDYTHASYVSVNNKYSGSLMRSSDVDYYYFNTSNASKVSISFSHAIIESSSTYWVIEVYTDELKIIEKYSVPGNKASITMPSIGLPSGKYYIKIHDYYSSSIDYSFTVGYTANNYWEKELNDDFYSASLMSVNNEYHGSLGNESDKDYYKFSLSSNSKVNITFKHDSIDSSSTYYELYIYDSSFEQIMHRSIQGKETSVTTPNIGLPSGNYYIRINDYYYDGMDYSIKVNSSSVSNWETERNNDYNSGDAISFNTTYYGSLCDSSDVDYYKFSLSSTSNISFYLEHNYIDSSGTYWQINLYDTNGNNKISASAKGNQTLTSSSSVSLPAGNYYIKITNYYFDGGDYWFMVNGPTTTYTISYNANGGSGAPSSQTKYQNQNLTLSSTTPTRTGYTFLGWSTSSTATSATYSAGGTYTANASATLYAVWKINTYTISYNANGGSGAPSSQTKYYNQTLTLSTTKPTRSGYTFLGWSTSSTATSATYSSGGSYTSNSNATLYAVWSANPVTYTISYNANGGSGAPSSQTKTQGVNLTLSSVKPTRTGYTFLGWSTSSTATSATYSAGGTYTANSSATLYAVWKSNPTPTNAKIAVESKTASSGKEVKLAISLSDNPGLAYLKLKVSYNASALEFVSAQNTGLLTGTFTTSKTTDVNPYVIQWMGADDSNSNGTIVNLTFRVKDDAAEGNYTISLTPEEAYNAAYDDVAFTVTDGVITVKNVIVGDVNGDGTINGKDGILLAQYLADWNVTIVDAAADCNGDGTINGKDGILLAQYLADWNVTLG